MDALEQAAQTSSNVIPFKHAFARFLQLARRDRKLSLEQFAKTWIRRIRRFFRGCGSLVDRHLKHVFEFHEFLTNG